MSLSDRGIRNLKPTEKDQFIADGDGLYLRVYPSGAKAFVYRSREGGKARWLKMGSYPALSLADARKQAHTMSQQLPEHLTMNCQDCYDTWMKGIERDYVRPDHVRYLVTRYFLSKYASRLLTTIKTSEMSALLADVAATAPVAANRLLGMLKLMFSFAVQRGWITVSPVAHITRRVVGGKESSRDRVLTDDELVAFIKHLRSDRFALQTRLALGLALMTGQRSGEVRGLQRSEVAGHTWTLPGHRTKNGDTQLVGMTRLTTALLDYAFKELGDAPFDSMDRNTMARAVARMGFDPAFTPHDLRRTMATRMADLGVAPHVVEKCLNHRMTGVMGIYNRADYAAEKVAAWRLWHRHLLTLAKK